MHGIDLLIDDGLSNCLEANRRGVTSIWLNNRNHAVKPSRITNQDKFYTAKNWTQIEKIIQKLILKANAKSSSEVEQEKDA